MTPALNLAGSGMHAFLIRVMGRVARMKSETALMVPAVRFVAKRPSGFPMHFFWRALTRKLAGKPHEKSTAKK